MEEPPVTPKKFRKLTRMESLQLLLVAGRLRTEVDTDLGLLIERVAGGDDTALLPAVDRLIELDRPEIATQLKRLVTGE